MKWTRNKKIALVAGVVVIAGSVVGFTVSQSRKNVASVQTAKVARQDLASMVSASGEIKPKMYVNIGANAFGRIVKLYVKEGDHVKKGQLLAQLENVQSSADVAAGRANVEALRTDAVASVAGYRTANADLNRARAEAERAKLEYVRAEQLFKAQLISQSDYDMKRTAYDSAEAALAQATARVAQAKAQADASNERIHQGSANLTRASDVLSKTTYLAPFDGVITNLPVREGETVVVGIQNSPGSTLMTIADLSVITAEVKVDETDIVNVKIGQLAEVTIDAIPKTIFKGRVTEIGNIAVVRSTGVATSQTLSSSQEAKDFKVVVTLENPPPNLRPGLSTTAKITTSEKKNAIAIPIQALTIRKKSDLEEKKKDSKGGVQAATTPPANPKEKDEELQGVFVIRDKKAIFVAVETGITGTTDIEVLAGLKEGDEIVTGSYKVLRNLKTGSNVKVDNSVVVKKEEES